jgi:hypothetical protein
MIFLYTFWNNFKASLTSKELFEISGEISERYAPVKSVKTTEFFDSSVSTQQALLEVSQNISRYFAPRISSNSQRLVVLSIDPQHLYVCWTLDENQNYILLQSKFNKEMTLRVYSQLKGKPASTLAKPLVEIAIDDFHSRQRIFIPTPDKPTVYSASIGQTVEGEGFVSLLDSNNTHAVEGIVEQNNIINQDKAVDCKKAGFKDISVLYDRPASVKSHYASTNNSAKGKRLQ